MEQTESESLYYAVTCTITITFRSWGGTCNTEVSWDAGRLAERKPASRWKCHSEVTKTLQFPRECTLECAHGSQKNLFYLFHKLNNVGLAPQLTRTMSILSHCCWSHGQFKYPCVFPLLSLPTCLAFRRQLTVQVIYYSGQKQTKKK